MSEDLQLVDSSNERNRESRNQEQTELRRESTLLVVIERDVLDVMKSSVVSLGCRALQVDTYFVFVLRRHETLLHDGTAGCDLTQGGTNKDRHIGGGGLD